MFCKHEWKILSQTTTKSIAEKTLDMGGSINFHDADDCTKVMSKKLIQIVTCEKCGKLKRFVTDI